MMVFVCLLHSKMTMIVIKFTRKKLSNNQCAFFFNTHKLIKYILKQNVY